MIPGANRNHASASTRLILGLLVLSLAACGNPDPPPLATAPEIPAPRILQFYAYPGQIAPGEEATLCYGVENAKTVRIEPEVEKLNPALSRCFPVSPGADAQYTLHVEGPDGSGVSQSVRVLVRVGPPPPPEVVKFSASAREIARGESVTICFEAQNARKVRLEPPVQTLGAATRGCFAVFPRETTQYTLVAVRGGARSDRKKLTVTVR